MSKRLLLCLWGHRTSDLPQVLDYYHTQFAEYTIDTLLSTWDDVDTSAFNFTYTIKNPSPTHESLDAMEFPYSVQIRPWHHHPARFGQYALYFHAQAISQYIKQHNLQYDVLIKVRTDLFFTTNYTFDFEQDTVYLLENLLSRGLGINDNFFAGKFEYTLNAFSVERIEEWFPFITLYYNPEVVWERIFKDRNITYVEVPTNEYHLLPNRRIK